MKDDITKDPFHCCALTAFVEQARLQQAWPELGTTRRRAYRLYEEALYSKNRGKIEPCGSIAIPFDATADRVIGSS